MTDKRIHFMMWMAKAFLYVGLVVVLAACAYPPELDSGVCKGSVIGGWWECDITEGSYEGFKTGMTQEEAYQNICEGEFLGKVDAISLMHKNDPQNLLGDEFFQKNQVCSSVKPYKIFDDWSMVDTGKNDGRRLWLYFDEGRLSKIRLYMSNWDI
jgi:hypothetical protein